MKHAEQFLVTKIPSPLGTLLAYADEKGLVALDFPGSKPVRGIAVATPKDRDSLKAAAAALRDYFAGRKPLPRNLNNVRGGTAFQRKVWKAIARIPFGKVKSYGEIAREIGSPGAARAVGAACGANPLPLFVPCHRVVASNGELGGFSGGLGVKKKLLRLEGTMPGK